MASRWFEVEDGLLSELKLARGAQAAPELPGYDELLEVRRGGQGVVYSAVQRSTRRRVAVKVLRDGWAGSARGQAAARVRFEREVDAVASLKHPNIVSLYDSGLTFDGRPYLVMEFVDGRPLDEALAGLGSSTPGGMRPALALLATVARAVEHAHLRGVIHRDLKPSNVRVDREGRAKVLDFGLAKVVGGGIGGGSGGPEVSLSGQFVGSLAWASPEQVGGDASAVDARTDVYSLGVILYSALTGRMPYEGASVPGSPSVGAAADSSGGLRAMIERIATAPPMRMSRVAPWVGDEVETIVQRCLAKDPARRYGGAGELAADIERFLEGRPILAKGDSALYAVRASLRRHRAVALGALACLAVSAVAAGWLWVLYGRAIEAERSAAQQRDAAAASAATAEATAGFLREMLAAPDPNNRGREVRVTELLDSSARKLTRSDDAATPAEGRLPPVSRAALLGTLGTTYLELGEWAKAEPLLVAALAERRRLLGEGHNDTIASVTAMSYLRRTQGKLDEGLTLARQAVALASEHLAPGTIARLDAQHALGLALMERGLMDECVPVLERAVEEGRQAGAVLGDEPQTVVNSLALAYRKQRQLDRAEALYRDELARAIKGQGPDGPMAATLRGNLGSLLHERLKFGEAEEMYRASLAARERLYGAEHPEVLGARLNIAKFLTDRRRFDEAGPMHEQLASTCERVLGPEHPTTLIVLSNYAFYLDECGKKEEALAVMKKALEIRKRTLGVDHPSTLISMNNIAGLMSNLGQREQGLAMHMEVLGIREGKLGPEHRDTLISVNNAALVLQALERHEEAEKMFRRASDGASKTLGKDNWLHGAFRGNLGRCLVKLGRTAEAETELLESHRVLAGSQGAADPRTRQTARSLADLYTAAGKADEAAKWAELGKAPPR